MSEKQRIVGAGNTLTPAYLTLVARGYRVRREKHADGSGETWTAENDNAKLVADDLLSLLGLAMIRETRGENWMAADTEIPQGVRLIPENRSGSLVNQECT